MDASGDTGVPMAFGVLTTNSIEEAQARAVDGPSNKGWEAAAAAIEMAAIVAELSRRTERVTAAAGRGARKDSRRRARESALQILYQWDIGRSEVQRAAETVFRAAVARRQPASGRAPRLRDRAGGGHRRAARLH